MGHFKEDSFNALKAIENIYVETPGTLLNFIELSLDVDEDRILFGSDVPYYRYPAQIAIVEAAEISQKPKRNIFYGSFQNLFNQK